MRRYVRGEKGVKPAQRVFCNSFRDGQGSGGRFLKKALYSRVGMREKARQPANPSELLQFSCMSCYLLYLVKEWISTAVVSSPFSCPYHLRLIVCLLISR
ncbi:uncharacterized protein BO72DRAFT_260605 [Aspergillus fijiensis CBS 313.89]|uniref:Uncharacterized protein n=1 Tax=Aspergillus fijiensis CBS 313.89 TaxID=1448319 RepID=A0A8G1VXA0_9EURO|nr:uncharacterized protein BO72DRAFT_260605 [Aspergillus fijiensis CBS 313.89]RAK72784.1 hypothetical protein BO72DRAFT_260605 [Aspergillus fijiensis CBS 313.89]